MAQGYLSHGVCFPTLNQAIDNHYSLLPPVPMPFPTGDMYVLDYVYLDEGQWQYRVTLYPSSQQQQLTVTAYGTLDTIQLPVCDVLNDPMTNFQDGMELGWGVATVMVVVYCIMRLKRGF
ncbi:MAG TPA: hypothetical protein VGJ90_06230 [Methylophilaceae bacterium]|jgi:hypothetical protein